MREFLGKRMYGRIIFINLLCRAPIPLSNLSLDTLIGRLTLYISVCSLKPVFSSSLILQSESGFQYS